MKHTKELYTEKFEDLRVCVTSSGEICIVTNFSSLVLATVKYEEHARRIVACFNELAGKPEGYVEQLERQKAELVEALERIKNYKGSDFDYTGHDFIEFVCDIVEKALTKSSEVA